MQHRVRAGRPPIPQCPAGAGWGHRFEQWQPTRKIDDDEEGPICIMVRAGPWPVKGNQQTKNFDRDSYYVHFQKKYQPIDIRRATNKMITADG